MNDNSRKAYVPAPVVGQMKCPKDGALMKPGTKDPSVSVCTACGFSTKRVKLS